MVLIGTQTKFSLAAALALSLGCAQEMRQQEPTQPDPPAEPEMSEPEPPAPSCPEDRLDPNHTTEEPSPIAMDQLLEDLLICSDSPDIFSLGVEEGQKVTVKLSFEHARGDLDLYVFAPGEFDPQRPLARSESVDDDEAASFSATVSGAHLVVVRGFEGASNGYSIGVEPGCLVDAECPAEMHCERLTQGCHPYEEPSCGADGALDPNGSDSRAIPIDFDGAGAATLEDLGTCPADIDFFALALGPGESLTASALPAQSRALLRLFLQNSRGEVVASASETDSALRTIDALHMPADDYRLGVAIIEDELAPQETKYSLALTLDRSPCLSSEDCKDSEARRFCRQGVCVAIEGEGDVPLGGSCDDNSDCDGDAIGCFRAAEDSDAHICTTRCRLDAQCSSLGDGAHCNSRAGLCALACSGDEMCPQGTFCNQDRCMNCDSDLDCQGRDDEVCIMPDFGTNGLCAEATAVECGQDAQETNNSFNQATPLVLGTDPVTIEALVLCNEDDDFFTVSVDEPGHLSAEVTNAAGSDLDIWIIPEEGGHVGRGVTFSTERELAVAHFIPEGNYTIRVLQYPQMVDVETPYTLSISLENATCAGDDCLGTVVRRLSCEEGACRDLRGQGEVGLGGACDSTDDCSLEADICFRDAPGGATNICTLTCENTFDCLALPETSCVDPIFESIDFGSQDTFCLPNE